MSDEVYFLCLAVTVICAVTAPVFFLRGIVQKRHIGRCAVIAGFSVILGFCCAGPFGATREAPWLAWIAGVYFGGMTLSVLFYGTMLLTTVLAQGMTDDDQIDADD